MRILKTLMIIFLYELSKEITYEIICRKQANDMVDKYPKDYEITKRYANVNKRPEFLNSFNLGGL